MATMTSAATAAATSSTVMDAAASSSSASSSASAAIKSLSSLIASASAAISSESVVEAGGGKLALPPWTKWLGLALAVGSGFLIGSSFVFKKKGLLAAQKKYQVAAGESYAYLKSPMWWTGMTMMIVGEILNLVAYAVTSAVLVTPLGALSVVICAILSSIFLKETLTLFGKVGCFLCIVGSTIIALNGPSQHAAGQIRQFEKMFVSVGFLVWAGVCIAASLGLFFFAVPRWGKKNMLVHISICSLIGGLSVSTISGVGSAIVLSIQGDNQFKYWFIYFLLAFVTITLVTEIIFLNKALELFNTALVTPTYYVLFTFATLVTSIILFQGLDSTPIQIVTIVLGFLTICAGITLLQLSKIDPQELSEKDGVGLDRNTTLLIRASRSQINQEKGRSTGLEDPGVDSVRGGLGVIGSLVRARSSRRIRAHASSDEYHRMANEHGGMLCTLGKADMERYELQDRPMPKSPTLGGLSPRLPLSMASLQNRGMPQKRDTAISFASGSENPHGHHANVRGASGTSATSNHEGGGGGGAILAGGILMSPNHSGGAGRASVFHAEPSSYSRGQQQQRDYSTATITTSSSISNRPTGPRLPRSDAADNLSSMWSDSGNGDLASTLRAGGGLKSPVYTNDEGFSSREFIETGDDTESTASSSPIKSKRAGGIFNLRSPSQRQRDGEEDGQEEELLSPVMRNDLEAFSNKRRSRG